MTMSGLEVAGLMLGALPILIEAVTSYKNGIQTGKLFFRKQVVVNKLASALLLQQETLAQTIKLVITQSGYQDLLDFDKDPYECLTNSEVHDYLLEYLGTNCLSIFNESLTQSHDTVRRVARNIACFVPDVKQGSTDDLLEIIKINKDRDRKWRSLVPRVKLMFSASEISKAIQDLDSVANSLLRLTSLIASNQDSAERFSSRKAKDLRRGLQQVRRFAVGLHQAILGAWRSNCHNHHEAKLLIEDRIESAINMFKGTKKDSDLWTMGFRLIFSASSPQQEHSWHEATIMVSRELVLEDPNRSDEPPVYRNPRVTLALPERDLLRPVGSCVDDICAVLASIRRDQKKVALVLSKEHKMSAIISKEGSLVPCDHAEKIPLRKILCNAESTPRRENFALKPRMTLALGVASNLLQLSRTPWLQTPWSKDRIFFLRRSSAAGKLYDFTKPFISFTFNNHTTNTQTQTQSQTDPKVAFLELGILLLEIWNNETFETHFPTQQSPLEYYQRLALAIEWLGDKENPPPELYDRAVSHCIHSRETRFYDWEDVGTWDIVCQGILEPLHDICKQWRSLPQ